MKLGNINTKRFQVSGYWKVYDRVAHYQKYQHIIIHINAKLINKYIQTNIQKKTHPTLVTPPVVEVSQTCCTAESSHNETDGISEILSL